jgi:hypothetical protein
LLDKEGKVLVYSSDENKIDDKLKEVFGAEWFPKRGSE